MRDLSPHGIRVLGIAGSLRAGSYNRGLLLAAVELAPEGMEIRLFERLGEIPPYNADVDAAGEPEPVAALRGAIREADALLIATPEYNYGVPGVLKNAIDWASRPAGKAALNRKPAAIMGASGGGSGTARAQLALRQSFVFTETWALLRPEVLVTHSRDRFDAAGRLTDEATREHVHTLLAALADWTRRLAPPGK
jgi:chromate reductase, NAD(P)H dehydrogenase (quinone)